MTPHLGDLVGRPFAFGGQTSNGIGCYGTAREVLRRFGIPLIEVNTSDFNGAHSQVMDFMKNPRGVPPVIRKKTNGKILRVSELVVLILLVRLGQIQNQAFAISSCS